MKKSDASLTKGRTADYFVHLRLIDFSAVEEHFDKIEGRVDEVLAELFEEGAGEV